MFDPNIYKNLSSGMSSNGLAASTKMNQTALMRKKLADEETVLNARIVKLKKE